jgi:hypothetical protein
MADTYKVILYSQEHPWGKHLRDVEASDHSMAEHTAFMQNCRLINRPDFIRLEVARV